MNLVSLDSPDKLKKSFMRLDPVCLFKRQTLTSLVLAQVDSCNLTSTKVCHRQTYTHTHAYTDSKTDSQA